MGRSRSLRLLWRLIIRRVEWVEGSGRASRLRIPRRPAFGICHGTLPRLLMMVVVMMMTVTMTKDSVDASGGDSERLPILKHPVFAYGVAVACVYHIIISRNLQALPHVSVSYDDNDDDACRSHTNEPQATGKAHEVSRYPANLGKSLALRRTTHVNI